jgi:hypothetical protein
MAGTGCWQYCAKLATPPDGEIAITIAVFPAVGVFGHPVRFRAFEKSGRPSLPGAPPFFAFGWLGLVSSFRRATRNARCAHADQPGSCCERCGIVIARPVQPTGHRLAGPKGFWLTLL